MGGGVQEIGEARAGFWWENLSRRDHLEGFGIHGIFKKWNWGGGWNSLIWLKLRKFGGLL
jgi:hypothetical protein